MPILYRPPTKTAFITFFTALSLFFAGCVQQSPSVSTQPVQESVSVPTTSINSGQIYLYGEKHSDESMLELELQIWQDYYHNDGMRHLFVEHGYFTGAYLNLWMSAEDDSILDQLFLDWEGTQACSEASRSFLKAIKETCPETVFHGTDVGHQYWSTGARYLAYLEENQLQDSEDYQLARQAIEQGKTYYSNSQNKDVYRENILVENFIREFNTLYDESIMGIYGAAHIGLDQLNYSQECDSMATQLKAHYGSQLYSEDLAARLLAAVSPLRQDTIQIAGKDYTAEYYGEEDISAIFPAYKSRKFWHIQNAYADLVQWEPTGNILPQSNYPMLVEQGQVYMIEYICTDGTQQIEYHICDGLIWNGSLTTREVTNKS